MNADPGRTEGRPTFSIVTFGCQMNRHDSERVAGSLVAAGYAQESIERADVILYNTCCVREGASQRLKGQVAAIAALKRQRRGIVIGVLGCLAQAEGERLARQLPHVDLVVGTHRLGQVPMLVDAVRESRTAIIDVGGDVGFTGDLPSRRESVSRAWIAITEGCDNRCSYCIVPDVRGPERSRPIEAILKETEDLLANGVLQITLLGQNVNSYGRDLYGAPRFAELLRRVHSLGAPRIRFVTSHPKDFSDEVIAAIAECSSVCEHVHLPAQSGNDRILAAMGRRYTRDDYLNRVERLRDAVADVAVSTDLMVAFPTETRAEFEQTVSLVEEVGFSQAFTFVYSPREGTAAAALSGAVPIEEARERMSRLVAAVNTCALSVSRARLGRVEEVLVEGPARHGPGRMQGKSRRGHTVILDSKDALPDQILTARIVEAHTWFLVGEVSSDAGLSAHRTTHAPPADPCS